VFKNNLSKTELQFLENKAVQIRKDIINAIYKAGKGHIGGAYSIVEILTCLYYGKILKFDAEDPKWDLRDRFILSKGHAGIALYAVLADLGFFPKEELDYLNKGRLLAEHPDPSTPGIEVVSGSLGHGLSIGSGMALANKLDQKTSKTYVLMGDGECYEGSVWEAAMFASHHQLHNLCAIVDRNKLITFGNTESLNKIEPFKDKWLAFGWDVFEVNGHDMKMIIKIMLKIKRRNSGNPSLIIANTIKGKGVTFMENEPKWHHGVIDDINLQIALKELGSIS
jgi:transketolase